MKTSEWTEIEDMTLRIHYPTAGAKVCARYLPRRTISAIRNRAYKHGLHSPLTSGTKRPGPPGEAMSLSEFDGDFFGGVADLRLMRRAARLTRQQAADKAGVHLRTIENLELYRTAPKWSVVRKLLNVYGFDLILVQREDQ